MTANLYELVNACDLEREPEPPSYALVDYLLGLGDGELMVLSFIAERLEQGRRLHGDLDVLGDRRDWGVELGEEAADALVYAAALRLRDLATGRPPLTVVRREDGELNLRVELEAARDWSPPS